MLTYIYVVLLFVIPCQPTGMIKLFSTGFYVTAESASANAHNVFIPMNTGYVTLEVVSPTVTQTAAIYWAWKCSFQLLLCLLQYFSYVLLCMTLYY